MRRFKHNLKAGKALLAHSASSFSDEGQLMRSSQLIMDAEKPYLLAMIDSFTDASVSVLHRAQTEPPRPTLHIGQMQQGYKV